MTTTAVKNLAGEKEKVEKRRALGRGLESLLPGPRVAGLRRSHPSQRTRRMGHPHLWCGMRGRAGRNLAE